MTWEIVGVLVAAAGLCVTLIAAAITQTNKLTEVCAILQRLERRFDDSQEKSHETHKDLYDKIDENKAKIAAHDRRITRLETKEGITSGDNV